ncbi:MAG: amidohydrolase [Prevotellaceae bacterium]|jgi:hippurate hydrolase|nr:amidohydrolase [Prevotellaceae bacterium]
MNKLEDILRLNKQYIEYVRSCYRHLHAHPELSFCEFETSLFVQRELSGMGVEYKTGFGGNGVLGKIAGEKKGGKVIALRADMDALPISETVELPWKSTREKVMHACGHDAHTACLLGAAKILNELKNSFAGAALLIFQPGEEKAPGGARLMLEDGVFDGIEPELIIGQHVSVDYPTGTVAFGAGKIMASADEIHVKIRGKGGHGALPHLLNDTVLAASQSIVALQQVKSRLCPPLTPMTLTFGKLIADGATNVVPGEVQIAGTFRTMDETWRETAKQHIRRIITETCAACGCRAEIEIPDGYPCVENNVDVTRKAGYFAQEFMGKERVKDLQVRMTSEDFGFFSQKYPSTFYRFGVRGNINSNTGDLHTPTFRIDEKALEYGSGVMAWLAWRFLTEE